MGQALGSQSHPIMRHMCPILSYPRTSPASIIQRNCAVSCWQAYFSLPKAVSHGNLGPAPLDANSLADHVCLCLWRVLSMLCFCSKELGGASIHRETGEQVRQVCRILPAAQILENHLVRCPGLAPLRERLGCPSLPCVRENMRSFCNRPPALSKTDTMIEVHLGLGTQHVGSNAYQNRSRALVHLPKQRQRLSHQS